MKAFLSSLRVRLMLLVLLAVLPALGLILYSGLEERREEIAQAELQASLFSEHISLYQDRLIEGTIQLLETLSQLPEVRERDNEKAANIFAAILKKHKQFSNIANTDSSGNIVASGVPLEKPTSVADRQYFQKALQNNRLVISEYLITKVTKIPALVISLPVLDNQELPVGVIYASLNLNYIASLAPTKSFPSYANVSITDTWGTVLYNNQKNEEMLGKPLPCTDTMGLALGEHVGMVQTLNACGKRVLFTFHPLSNVADVGYVFIELSYESILVNPNHILKRNLIGLGCVGFFAFIASWVLGSMLVTRRISALAHVADQLSKGDLTVRTGLGKGAGEIDKLSASFDRMAEGLQRREDERRQAEFALRASEEKYRLIVETASEGIWIHDENWKTTYVNSVMADMIGYSPEDLVGRQITDFHFEEDYRDHEKVIERRLRGVEEKYEARLRHKDGRAIWFLISAKPLFNAEHRFVGSFAMFADITDRKLAEIATSESKKKFEALFQFAPEAIFLEKPSGEIIDCNKAAEKMTGYSRQELIGMSIKKLLPGEELTRFPDIWKELLLKGEHSTESLNIRKDGEIYPVQVSTMLVDFDGEKTLIVIVSDITERKRLESEIVKIQKLESLGVLAGGIAHDFNNILTAVMGNISLAKFFVKPEDKVFKRLDEAEKAAMRAKDLTFQLLTFSKGGVPIRKVVSLPQVIRETCEFSLRGSNVGCTFDLPDDLWLVEADPGQISQVIHNIVLNAKQATPGGGVISVRAENVERPSGSHLPLNSGRYAKITIEDRGIGISKEHLTKIFDPYFTTKQDGSGLGLASCYSIIHKHGGYIDVESELGVGTAFHIFLAASDKTAAKARKSEEMTERRSGRVLVLDDEALIRDIAGTMLAELGYEAEFAEEGRAAVDLYTQAKCEGKPFDVVILDLTIPGGLGGRETIKLLKEVDPDVKAIVSSGYSNDPVMADYKKNGFRGFVAKPYRIGDLSDVLKKVIET